MHLGKSDKDARGAEGMLLGRGRARVCGGGGGCCFMGVCSAAAAR